MFLDATIEKIKTQVGWITDPSKLNIYIPIKMKIHIFSMQLQKGMRKLFIFGYEQIPKIHCYIKKIKDTEQHTHYASTCVKTHIFS